MSRTIDQGALPSWLRGVITNAYPVWPAAQLFSIVLPSTVTVRAFLNSTRFFTVQLCVRQASGLEIRFRRMVMFDGTRLGIDGSLPPNITFSAAASM